MQLPSQPSSHDALRDRLLWALDTGDLFAQRLGRYPELLDVLAMGAAAAAVWDLSGRRFPGRRQVNEDWLTSLRPWVYAVGFGAQLGAALATVVNTALVPLFMLAAVLTAQPVEGLLIGGAFGIVRGVSVTMSRRVRTVDDLRDLHRRLDGRADRARRLGVALCAVLAGVSAVSLLA